MTTVNDLNNIQPGQKVIYYTGSNIASAGIPEIRNTAYHLYMLDKVILVQKLLKRDGLGSPMFEYIAIGKSSPPDLKLVKSREEYFDFLNGGSK